MPRNVVRGLGWSLLTWFVATPLVAGNIGLAWSPAVNASGYRIYYGQQSGVYTQFVDVGAVTQATVTGLQDCTDYYLAVKAYNGSGESAGFSNEIAGWTRPEVSAAAPNADQQGDSLAVEVRGNSFQPGASVEIDNAHVSLSGVTVLDCSRIQVQMAIAPSAPGLRAAPIGEFAVTVVNPDDTYGVRQEAFEVQVDPGRFDVNRSDDATRDRLDGKDTVWLARLFGSQEGDALFDPDFDFDGNGWVDGPDLAYIASNLGRCWSGATWTVQACN